MNSCRSAIKTKIVSYFFTFLNGKIDLSEAEAVIDIISAKSRSAARAALCVKEGAVRNKIEEVKNLLLSTAANLSAWADYPEEDIDEVTDEQLYDSLDVSIAILDGLISRDVYKRQD